MDHSQDKDNFRNNCFIFKLNYFKKILIIFFFLINFLNNYLPPFQITTSILELSNSISLSTNMDEKTN